jgi:hypothetical protein
MSAPYDQIRKALTTSGTVFSTYNNLANTVGPFSQPASPEASAARQETALLREDVERLLMIVESLWGILKEKHGYGDEELLKRVYEIDFADGRLDGRVSKREEPRNCPHCNRVLARRRPTCIYCGKPVPMDLFGR